MTIQFISVLHDQIFLLYEINKHIRKVQLCSDMNYKGLKKQFHWKVYFKVDYSHHHIVVSQKVNYPNV